MTVQHIADLEPARRTAILVVQAASFETRLTDATLAMFEKYMGTLFSRARNRDEKRFQATRRDVARALVLFRRTIAALRHAKEAGEDGVAVHVRSPHFIDLVGDDGSVVRLLLVAPDAIGARASRSLPSPGARGEGSSEPRQRAVAPIFCDSLRRESRTLRFPGRIRSARSASGQGPVGPGR